MKIRDDNDFRLNAYELARQFGAPGDVSFAVKCLKFGYSLGLKDATDRLKVLTEQIKETKDRSNTPR